MSKTNLFGAFLKEKRQGANLSLRELAHSIGVAHTYILNIENGSKAPPGDTILKKITNALHFDTQTAELFYDLAAMCKQNDDGKICIYQQIYLNIYRKPSLQNRQ